MEQQDKQEDKRKKSTLVKVIIIIVIALFCYKIGSSILSGMKKATTEYSTEQESVNTD